MKQWHKPCWCPRWDEQKQHTHRASQDTVGKEGCMALMWHTEDIKRSADEGQGYVA